MEVGEVMKSGEVKATELIITVDKSQNSLYSTTELKFAQNDRIKAFNPLADCVRYRHQQQNFLALKKFSPQQHWITLVYFCTLSPPPHTLTLSHHSLSVNLSVRGVGGVVAPPPQPKPPPKTLLVSLPVCE
jgi:hypothetical protein